jgi:hypothetical protein
MAKLRAAQNQKDIVDEKYLGRIAEWGAANAGGLSALSLGAGALGGGLSFVGRGLGMMGGKAGILGSAGGLLSKATATNVFIVGAAPGVFGPAGPGVPAAGAAGAAAKTVGTWLAGVVGAAAIPLAAVGAGVGGIIMLQRSQEANVQAIEDKIKARNAELAQNQSGVKLIRGGIQLTDPNQAAKAAKLEIKAMNVTIQDNKARVEIEHEGGTESMETEAKRSAGGL